MAGPCCDSIESAVKTCLGMAIFLSVSVAHITLIEQKISLQKKINRLSLMCLAIQH